MRNQSLKFPLSLFLMLLLLIQPVGLPLAMAGTADHHTGVTPESSADHHSHPAANHRQPSRSQSDHAYPYQHAIQAQYGHQTRDNLTQDNVTQDNVTQDIEPEDCCNTAACCPAAVTHSGAPGPLTAGAATPLEFRVSFQAITPPIEIKPPRRTFTG